MVYIFLDIRICIGAGICYDRGYAAWADYYKSAFRFFSIKDCGLKVYTGSKRS